MADLASYNTFFDIQVIKILGDLCISLPSVIPNIIYEASPGNSFWLLSVF